MSDFPVSLTFSSDALRDRRRALEALGFVVVLHELEQLVAVRTRFFWGSAVRISSVVRVRRAATVDAGALREGLTELVRHAGAWDPSRIPRGFQQLRSILDVVLADEAAEDAVRYARATNQKGMGSVGQVVLVLPDGRRETCTVVWGAAYQPLFTHIGQVAATGTSTPPPGLLMGNAIGLLVMWPSLVVVTLMFCGLPLLVPLYAALTEKPPQPAPLPDGADAG